MKMPERRFASLTCTMLILAAPSLGAAVATDHGTRNIPTQDTLFITVSALDAELFNTFNHCASPNQLQKHASYFAPNVEFYHDKAGVTWSRHDYITNTKNNVCGKFLRQLVAGTLEVFPIKGYGAIEQGKHRFCWIKTGKCFGIGDFFILWHHIHGRWVVTRVFSYGHRPIGWPQAPHKSG
jgi:Domain of unknown function (DUF4440)